MNNNGLLLPNLLVIGGQKCGSTWIHKNLAIHKKCYMSQVKELTFFLKKPELHDLNVYAENFPITKNDYTYFGESTPVYFWTYDEHSKYCQYTYGNKNIASSIRNSLGEDLKIVLSLRNPVDRAVFAFLHHYKHGRFKGNESILDIGYQFGIVDMGFYKRHLLHWYNYYSPDNFTIIFFDDIKKDADSTLNNLLSTLKLENDFSTTPNVRKKNNPGFALKIIDDYITIDMDSSKKLNETAFAKNVSNLHYDYRIPKVYQNELKILQKIFMDDIKFVLNYFNRNDLNWDKEVELTSLLNN